jgi:hypothetical protein
MRWPAHRTSTRSANHLITFINRAMNPVSYARDPATFTWRCGELSPILAFSGSTYAKNGQVGHADLSTTLDAARALAGRLKAGPGKSGRAR